MAKIRVKIDTKGQTTIEGIACDGMTCKIKSRPFEEALGTVTDFVEKPEYYNEKIVEEQKQEVTE